VPRDGHTLQAEEIVAFCRDRLAGFKAPKYVVILDELPKNASGKILKRELRTAYGSLGAGAA
jgi:fatty-acyl-CoA synthase